MSEPAIHTARQMIRPEKDTFLAEENPFEAMMERFDHAAQLLKLDPGLYKVLRNPEKQIITSVPVVRDNGEVEVYTGYGGLVKEVWGVRGSRAVVVRWTGSAVVRCALRLRCGGLGAWSWL